MVVVTAKSNFLERGRWGHTFQVTDALAHSQFQKGCESLKVDVSVPVYPVRDNRLRGNNVSY